MPTKIEAPLYFVVLIHTSHVVYGVFIHQCYVGDVSFQFSREQLDHCFSLDAIQAFFQTAKNLLRGLRGWLFPMGYGIKSSKDQISLIVICSSK